MNPRNTELLQGTLDLLILQTLSLEPMRGWAVSQRIRQISGDVFAVNQGSLYPALARLERRGWISSSSAIHEGRQVKLYKLTRTGHRQLVSERAQWERWKAGVARILEAES